GQTIAVVDDPPGDRPELGVVMLHDRRNERRGSARPLRPEGMAAFHYAPAVVSAALDDEDLLPQVLADVSAPQVARRAVKMEFPRLAQTVRPILRPRILD